MAYLLECRDKPDSAALRQETRPAHLAYAKEAPAISELLKSYWAATKGQWPGEDD